MLADTLYIDKLKHENTKRIFLLHYYMALLILKEKLYSQCTDSVLSINKWLLDTSSVSFTNQLLLLVPIVIINNVSNSTPVYTANTINMPGSLDRNRNVFCQIFFNKKLF